MISRTVTWITLMVVGCVLSALITLYGVFIAQRIDFRLDTALTATYSILPILCFPAFILLRRTRRTLLLLIFACVFWAAFSALSWRTCSELGYCGSVASTVFETFATTRVLAFFGIAAVALALGRIETRRSEARRQNPAR
jgi:hypothetical protein